MSQTTVVNLKRSQYDVYIGRRGRGLDGYFGNPFRIKRYGDGAHLHEIMEAYRRYFSNRIEADAEFRRRVLELSGKRLGCFCKPGPCHGDVIAEWLNAQESPQ